MVFPRGLITLDLVMRWIIAITGVVALVGCSKWNEPRRDDVVSGTIETDESRVASRYGGRVEQVLAREGDRLSTGQPIVRLDAAELRARHAQAKALLAEMKAGARMEEIQAARNEWQAAAAELEFGQAEAQRAIQLAAEGTIPAAERDRAVSLANSLARTVAAAKSRHDLLLAGTRPEQITQAEARLREIETQLLEMEIRAPTNSILEVLHVKIGDVLAPNMPVATLLLTNHLWVRVYVPEPWLGFIRAGEQVKVKVDSFPNREFAGRVAQVARTAEFTPRNVQTVEDRVRQVFGIKIALPPDTGDLRAGMAADVYFPRIGNAP